MQKQFARRGYPKEIMTDSGKNYDSRQFAEFCNQKNIHHQKTLLYHYPSNGKARSAMKVIKNLLRKAKKSVLDTYESPLVQRNTQTAGLGVGPAQRFL